MGDNRLLLHMLKCKYAVPILVGIGLVVALVEIKSADQFTQIYFSVTTSQNEKVNCVTFLPRLTGKHPIVIYVRETGESLPPSGPTLQQFAELGLAAVGIEYNQTNQSAFDEQCLALQNYVQRQPWAQSNATAWVGFGHGAQRTISFLLNHPAIHPQLLVSISSGWVNELGQRFKVRSQKSKTEGQGAEPASVVTCEPQAAPLLSCPILIVHGGSDEVFPVDDAKRLAAALQDNGTPVELRILPDRSHDFGSDHSAVTRAVAEYCRAHLPLTDYASVLPGCQLNETERQRFNIAMQRAGQHREELLKAVNGLHEPERRTMMMVIGGLEDYDLTHATSGYLKEVVHTAWLARAKYPWCRDTPLNVFEKYTANPRVYEEPISDYRLYFYERLQSAVKYSHTTQEASDAVWKWMHGRMTWTDDELTHDQGLGGTPRHILRSGKSDCGGLALLYTCLCRSAGLAERLSLVVWQDLSAKHYITEVWSVQRQQWHALDSTAGDRAYGSSWMSHIPKAIILTPTGERGCWNAEAEGRREACSNTIALFYPSGQAVVRVLNHGIPLAYQVVGVQSMGTKEIIIENQTDEQGEVIFTLGRTIKHPYRLFVDQPGDTAWQWLAVEANHTHNIALDLANKRPFDPTMATPEIVYTNLDRGGSFH